MYLTTFLGMYRCIKIFVSLSDAGFIKTKFIYDFVSRFEIIFEFEFWI